MDRFVRLAAVVAGCLVGNQVAAQALPVPSYPTPTSLRVPIQTVVQGAVGRSITTAANDAVVLDLIKGKVGARELDLSVRRLITPAGIAKGIVKGGILGLGVGLIADLLLTTRCRADASGSWSCDGGQPKEVKGSWVDSWPSAACADSTPVGAYQCAAQRALGAFVVSAGTVKTLAGGASCSAHTPTTQNCTGLYFATTDKDGVKRDYSYDKSVYYRDDAQRCPDGSEPWEGRCTTQPQEWPKTEPAEVERKLEPKVAENPGPLVERALEKGITFEPQKHEVTGPATAQQPATTSTRTAPDGTPQTRTEQVTNHITYAGDTMTWTSTTVINDYDGTETITDERPKEDDRSECEKHPETIGCAAMDVPDVGDVQKKEVQVTYAEDGGFGSAGQCPAPKQVTAMGQTFEVSYQPLCDFMGWMRGIVVACAGFAAALIFVNGFKG